MMSVTMLFVICTSRNSASIPCAIVTSRSPAAHAVATATRRARTVASEVSVRGMAPPARVGLLADRGADPMSKPTGVSRQRRPTTSNPVGKGSPTAPACLRYDPVAAGRDQWAAADARSGAMRTTHALYLAVVAAAIAAIGA